MFKYGQKQAICPKFEKKWTTNDVFSFFIAF